MDSKWLSDGDYESQLHWNVTMRGTDRKDVYDGVADATVSNPDGVVVVLGTVIEEGMTCPEDAVRLRKKMDAFVLDLQAGRIKRPPRN